MKGEWKVTSQVIGDERKYAVCRLLDVDAVDHSGNREFGSNYMTDKDSAQALADKLNDDVGS